MCLDRLFSQFRFAAVAAASAAVNACSGGREVLAVLWAMLTAECRLAFGCALGFRKTERVADAAADCIPSAAMLFNLLVRSRRAFKGSCKFAHLHETKIVQNAIKRAVYHNKASKLDTMLHLFSTLCCLYQRIDPDVLIMGAKVYV